MTLIIRSLAGADIALDRLSTLIEKRLQAIPPVAQLRKEHVYNWIRNMAQVQGSALVVAEDPGTVQLVGVFVATPAYLLGAPVPVMADLLIVATHPEALPLMVEEVERRTKLGPCKSFMLTAETQNSEAAKRWGAKYGARLVAMTFFKEV